MPSFSGEVAGLGKKGECVLISAENMRLPPLSQSHTGTMCLVANLLGKAVGLLERLRFLLAMP
jgi:hypothetical protein